jgi:hypothetical protein
MPIDQDVTATDQDVTVTVEVEMLPSVPPSPEDALAAAVIAANAVPPPMRVLELPPADWVGGDRWRVSMVVRVPVTQPAGSDVPAGEVARGLVFVAVTAPGCTVVDVTGG